MENLVRLEDLSKYYQGKKVFVTGHTGFKGAWLSAVVHLLGGNVKGYSLEPEYENSLYNILEPFGISQTTIADIRARERLQEEILDFKPDFVFHLAAQPLVRRSYQKPAETFDVNVTGTANLLESIHRYSGRCNVVVITTDKVYENKETDILYEETDILGGYDPYSASKACTELVVSSFRDSFFNLSGFDNHGKSIASARAGNVIGGGDWNEDRIVPDIIRSLASKKVIDIRNPRSVRPWQHVLEPICGYLQLGALLTEDPLKYSRPYNFGPKPDDHLNVGELVDLAVRCWGEGHWRDVSDTSQPHEAGLLKLSINRAINELGWLPRLKTDQAIKWTIDWYKVPDKEKATFTFQQIKDYFDL